MFRNEDWLSIVLGSVVLGVGLVATWSARSADVDERVAQYDELTAELDALETRGGEATTIDRVKAEREALRSSLAKNPLKPYLAKIGSWESDPRTALVDKSGRSLLPGLAGVFAVSLVLFGLGVGAMGQSVRGFVAPFTFVFLLAVVAYVLAGQKVVKHYNLEYALWALLVGLILSNTLGTPAWMRPALRTEFYIKTGLVLLGAEILFNRLLALGVPGIGVSWVVTPIVLIGTYIFGQRVLRIESRSLNMVICADMSVCGVSAAIATAAACRAKKEELSLAIGLSLAFTVVMMIVMPAAIEAMGMNQVLAGAWIGGTIDSTGAVAAAGGILGETALA
ncbi:MAG TPA: putative sulfate exporter family transporter, partial [Pirellulales bacterium]|nr:putative sulfate exporter family transporter [Pirellulales bacterium]